MSDFSRRPVRYNFNVTDHKFEDNILGRNKMTDEEWIETWKRENRINNDKYYRLIKHFIKNFIDEKILPHLK